MPEMKFMKTSELIRIIARGAPAGAFVHESSEQKKSREDAEKLYKAAVKELDIRMPPRAEVFAW